MDESFSDMIHERSSSTSFNDVEIDKQNSKSDSDLDPDYDSSSLTSDSKPSNEYPFEVLSIYEVNEHQNELIEQVNNVLNLSPAISRKLLHFFKWDDTKVMEKYFDGNVEQLFSQAHIVIPKTEDIKPKAIFLEDCGICFTSCTARQMFGLACGHRFCRICWRTYLTSKILSDGVYQTICCPAHMCEVMVEDTMIAKLVTSKRAKRIYHQLKLNDFVDSNKLLTWCPAKGCTNVIRVSYVATQPVRCKCGHVFCFTCGENWHEPVKCVWLRKWLQKCSEDSATSFWIATNTKSCPQCNATIEKNGGCNHMVCKNQNCRYDFCWVCLGEWGPHGSSWYSCNRYEENAAKNARDAQEKNRYSLGRYLHYYSRYRNHMESLNYESNLYAAIRNKMSDAQKHSISVNEGQFLTAAVDVLCKCRQTLMFTYVFAFYLEKNNQSMIFEQNQKDLESATEKLSEYIERDVTPHNISVLREKIRDTFVYCDQRRIVLVDHVHDGYDNRFWEFTE